MKTIPLTRGKVTLVSDEDYERIRRFPWHTHEGRVKGKLYTHYAKSRVGISYGPDIYLHRFILNAPKGLCVDHINGDGLDNRRENLRLCTPSQNHGNSHRVSAKSGYKGVTRSSKSSWQARIKIHQKMWNIGSFKTPEEAAKAYNIEAVKFFGEFARLNEVAA